MYINVALTGATGTMGGATMEALLREGCFKVRVLARRSGKNIKMLSPLIEDGKISVVWGDLANPDSLKELIEGSDILLHIGGMVSPRADWYPEETMRVNTSSMRNIVDALVSSGRTDMPVINIGSVSQTGNREVSNRFGRTGDPIAPARFDAYAMSKCIAERTLAESPLKRWASLRQSGILYPKLLMKANDPITFHVPLNGMLEWATVEDSARLMVNICKAEIPETFWKRFYNISSGKAYRLTNYEFEEMLLSAIGIKSPKKVFEPQWFALKNFHGQWYADAGKLEKYFSFRENIPASEYFRRMVSKVPSYFRLARFCPSFVMKAFMGHVAMNKTLGTRYWVKSGNEARVDAFYGGMEAYRGIKPWKGYRLEFPETDPAAPELQSILLEHGYDDGASSSSLNATSLQEAAAFRGGLVVSAPDCTGEELLDAKVEWECHDGHRFVLSPRTVLMGGYWCPECMESPDDYPRQAVHNKFLAQVVAPLHDGHDRYKEDTV